jgi:UDP-N-acetylmuramyl-tripeptide synthetase
MQSYWQAKLRLFDWAGLRCAVVGIDDPKGIELLAHLRQHHPGVQVMTYGLSPAADVHATDVRWQPVGANDESWCQSLNLIEGGQIRALQIPWVGEHNVRNLLAVVAALRLLGHGLDKICDVCARLQAVPGRMQALQQNATAMAVVDYAHTPDALTKALQALRPLAEMRGGRLWCVFGCGGDRDRAKRAEMGRVAQALSDQVLLTSDNPRSEDPMAIVRDIRQGLIEPATNVQVQIDRARAIAQVMNAAAARDIVLIAGKGHETYQEVAGERQPFSDVEQVRLAWRKEAA